MVSRLLLVMLAFVAVAAGCGSPTSPTSTSAPASPVAGSAGPATSPPPAGAPGSLRIDAATVIEFQYKGSPEWIYAPQVRVAEMTGNGGISITRLDISIPGHSSWACDTSLRLGAGQGRELFEPFYGEYPLTFSHSGHRSSGHAHILIRFVDDLGQSAELSVTAPITPGELPAYSGMPERTLRWSCRSRG